MHRSSLITALTTILVSSPFTLAVILPCPDIVPVCGPSEELCGRCKTDCCPIIQARDCPPLVPIPCDEGQHACGPCGTECCDNTSKRSANPSPDICPDIVLDCPADEQRCGHCVSPSSAQPSCQQPQASAHPPNQDLECCPTEPPSPVRRAPEPIITPCPDIRQSCPAGQVPCGDCDLDCCPVSKPRALEERCPLVIPVCGEDEVRCGVCDTACCPADGESVGS